MHLILREITKTFGRVPANDRISLTVEPGIIHGLLGENGAGKSTLMKALSGFISADSGEIVLDGKSVRFRSPLEALEHGIGMLHQDPLDFPTLSVLENFMLGMPGTLPPRAAALAQLLDLSRQFDFTLAPESPAGALSPGERQQLEIVRLLARGAELLILDEPTTGISQVQKVKLFVTLQKLAAQGKSIILVTHKLEDAETLCQRVTVLRRGRVVGEVERPFTTQKLVQLMFGQELPRLERPALSATQTTVTVRDLAVHDHRMAVEAVNLEIMAGEVIGLAGLEGSGQRLVMRALGGLLTPSHGEISVGGQSLAGKPYSQFLRTGVAYLPAGRMDEGLVPGLNLTEHFELARRSHDFTVDWKRAEALAAERIDMFSIRGRPATAVDDLSGGNQQRALLALLPEQLSLLLLEHPTRGLDIESSAWVWTQLLERRRHGTAIIFISADLDEILAYSDRIVVFSGGQVSAPLAARDATVEQLGNLIGGKRAQG
ncbi:MAG: ATP-binding cassette domain-containing protein [Chloroflexi bacterium]|nr:ATP-binding cassette domain-containing protein [Chloroflexota bacterium]